MDIITDLPKNFTDDEINSAFMQEIKNGFQLEKETEEERVRAAAKQAAHLKGTSHPVLGRPVATMPAREFFRLTSKYGHKEVHSKEFLKHYNKTFEVLSPNKI
jgi:formiminotetrahydrofolate cyclodeaminase